MAKGRRWINVSQLPVGVAEALRAYQECVGNSHYIIRWFHSSGVGLQVSKPIPVLPLARLSKQAGLSVEVGPVAKNHLEIRLFISGWEFENIAGQIRDLSEPLQGRETDTEVLIHLSAIRDHNGKE